MITRLNPAVEVEAAIITAIKEDASLTALVSRIYPQQAPNKPQRPFILFGSPFITPRKVDGGDCANVEAAVHCFADKSATIMDARIFVTNVAAHILRILDGMEAVSLGDGAELQIYVGQVQVMNDGDPSSWHSFVTFRAESD